MSWTITGTQKVDWDPSLISTALWLDGSDNTTIFSDAGTTQATNGAAVQQWNDKSGNNRHVTQATAGNRPSFTANSLNGRSSITFADTARWLLGSSGDEAAFDFTSSCYTFVVCQISAANGNVIINKGRNTFNTTGWYVDVTTTNQGLIGVTSFASYSSINTANTAISLATDVILSFEASGSTGRSRLNGTTKSTTVVNKASWIAAANNDTLSIGAYTLNAVPANFEGIIRQIIVMPTVPNLETIEKLEGWAAHYYGLTANLPSNHPYKVNPPAP